MNPNRLRDSQRSREYDAERQAFTSADGFSGPPLFKTAAECQSFVDDVCRTEGIEPIMVKDGRGRVNAGAYFASRTITLPRWARSRHVILHEIAHHMNRDLNPAPLAPHGPEFARTYLDLVRRILGSDEALSLLACFKIHRVKVGKAVR